MRYKRVLSTLILPILIVLLSSFAVSESKVRSTRQVSVTIDDLPITTNLEVMTDLSRTLLREVISNRVPATAFVVESRILQSGNTEQMTALVREWSDAGIELGNHTFSHPNFAETSLPDYEKDVIAGEPIASAILKEKGKKLRYFRFPYLATGPDLAAKREFERFLAARGYQIAPVTIDSKDYLFAPAYGDAKKKGDAEAIASIQHDYLTYVDQLFSYYEQCSRLVFGREIPQVLRIHANTITKDTFDELIKMIQARRYVLIPLDQSLADKAYQSPESYVGKEPLSWIQRWAMEKKVVLPAEPVRPKYAIQ